MYQIYLNLTWFFYFKNFHFKKFEPFCVWLVFVLKSILYWGSAHVVKHDPNNYPSNATSSGNPVFNFKILESFVRCQFCRLQWLLAVLGWPRSLCIRPHCCPKITYSPSSMSQKDIRQFFGQPPPLVKAREDVPTNDTAQVSML